MIRRLVLDIMKPHQPDVIATTERLSKIDGIDGATTTVVEMDEAVQETRVTLEGDALDLEEIEGVVENLGGSIHSIDEVSCGERIVDEQSPAD